MKALNYLAALSLSFILGVMPFAVITLDEAAAAKAQVVSADAANSVHALGMEGR
jgi:hypothetical protein